MAAGSTAKWIKRIGMALLATAAAGGIYYALQAPPVPIDIATVTRGDLEVTVAEEGVTRIRDVYEVSAPIGGRIARTDLEVGDPVVKDETIIASIYPGDPPFLDTRTQRERAAAVDAAQASVSLAEAEVARAQFELRLARSTLNRARQLRERNTISEHTYERALTDVDLREAQLSKAMATLSLRRSELESARARLLQPVDQPAHEDDGMCCMNVLAPVGGVALKVPSKSERVVAAGALLAEIGDPRKLEIVVDLLSADAVKIKAGAHARLIDWGGGDPLDAVVRRIDPVGFTKVSALGIEEQRVNAVLDFVDPGEQSERLGHDFRVFVEIITDNIANALLVPLGALFRRGPQWAVFKMVDGTARLTEIELGARNDESAVVISGLSAGDTVILHPSDRIADGTPVRIRTEMQ